MSPFSHLSKRESGVTRVSSKAAMAVVIRPMSTASVPNALFKNSGCVACHNGPAVGGTSFQKMGVVEPYKATSPAEGRSAVTGKDADRFNFKVPTLRNVELTYPYFHDGEAATLEKAVDVMGRLQLGKQFTTDENASIVAFLKTLTGKQPNFKLPTLPPSSNATPQPKPFE